MPRKRMTRSSMLPDLSDLEGQPQNHLPEVQAAVEATRNRMRELRRHMREDDCERTRLGYYGFCDECSRLDPAHFTTPEPGHPRFQGHGLPPSPVTPEIEALAAERMAWLRGD